MRRAWGQVPIKGEAVSGIGKVRDTALVLVGARDSGQARAGVNGGAALAVVGEGDHSGREGETGVLLGGKFRALGTEDNGVVLWRDIQSDDIACDSSVSAR